MKNNQKAHHPVRFSVFFLHLSFCCGKMYTEKCKNIKWVTYARVTPRDILCEGTEMTVTCYPFTGSAWTESTAWWDNLPRLL